MANLDYGYIAQLVKLAKGGNSDAFAELYAATYQKQYYFAFQYLKNPQDAQDALQETYILALKNLSRLKDPTLLIAWLNQINFRVCYNMSRKLQRYSDPSENPELWTDLQNPEEKLLSIDSKEYLMQQIMKLPCTESQVILLKYYQNLQLEEIAGMLDMSRSTVKRYLKSGKDHLKNLLQLG